MKSRRQNVSNVLGLTITRNIIFQPIPVDLIIEILLRLPTKSIARCSCVSKLWASILTSSHFTDLFLTKSSASPQLLFLCEKNGELLLYKSPQPQNIGRNSSPITASYHHTKIPFGSRCVDFNSIFGFVLIKYGQFMEKAEYLPLVICNLSTGQFITLPEVKTEWSCMESFFGYDPIEKQFKVLSMTLSTEHLSKEHQVLTLGTKELSWRRVECCIPHYPGNSQICINGVLYYSAVTRLECMVVCFDVRSEKFSFIVDIDRNFLAPRTMINYNGKLGALMFGSGSSCHYKASKSMELWVLEDAEKQVWSMHTKVLPSLLDSIDFAGREVLRIVGLTRTNDIVLSHPRQSTPFYVFYYNLERSTIRRIEIQGMEAVKGKGDVYMFLDHVDNVKLMHGF